MTEPRRLRGHNAAATCCIASTVRPGLLVTAAEDGCVCLYDLRCKDVLFAMDLGNGNAISSLCFKPGSEDVVYVSAGNELKLITKSVKVLSVCYPLTLFLPLRTCPSLLRKVTGRTKKEEDSEGGFEKEGGKLERIVKENSGPRLAIEEVKEKRSWKKKDYSENGFEEKGVSSAAEKDKLKPGQKKTWELLIVIGSTFYNYVISTLQIACHSKSSFLAAADDAGDVKIIDVHQRCLYKTLRAGHKSICSSVQFLPWRSWEVITGGLDSKLVMWDFSKGRPNKIMDFGSEGDAGQCCNPAFVHAIIVPDLEIVDKVGKICVVARGDGVVNIINIESELAALKSKISGKSKHGTKSTSKDSQPQDLSDRKVHLDYSVGGHVAAVSSVTFSMFGEKGKFIISGGNDKSVKVWDWSKSYDAGQTSEGNDLLRSNISLRKKVNWLCTTPSDSENLVVCDTSKVVKVYTVG
ncbi:hypothetical protein BUALT_Bualt03G0042700 [Buddleja alternifolia]|uniref:WD repeat-containing protein 53 n=1 Tax=Buddleja alternifolia TaxID=168488 RepID=A0AAV6XZB6_9LAMI|nr:hypothetical protein BUALT_Bualt03G0042700 [Buddleja alternifolia]